MGFAMAFSVSILCLHTRKHEALSDGLRKFYRTHEKKFRNIFRKYYFFDADFKDTMEIYSSEKWCLVNGLLSYEEWVRERNIFITKYLSCSGIYIYEYDGNFWGYEVYIDGIVVDRFLSDKSFDDFFYSEEADGSVDIVTRAFPFIDGNIVEKYLIQYPDRKTFNAISDDYFHDLINIPPRTIDLFNRWDGCASINFMRAIGLNCGIENGTFSILEPLVNILNLPD